MKVMANQGKGSATSLSYARRQLGPTKLPFPVWNFESGICLEPWSVGRRLSFFPKTVSPNLSPNFR
jgi:hypothetical protein